MVLKELKKIDEHLNETLSWCGAASNYLNNTISSLESIKSDPSGKLASNNYKNAENNFRYARRCERRINQNYSKLKENLNSLSMILPDVLKKELDGILANLRPHEAKLIKETSFYTGELINNVEKVGVLLALVKKDPKNVKIFQATVEKVISNFKELLAASGSGINVGLIPFMAQLKFLNEFNNKLKKLSGR